MTTEPVVAFPYRKENFYLEQDQTQNDIADYSRKALVPLKESSVSSLVHSMHTMSCQSEHNIPTSSIEKIRINAQGQLVNFSIHKDILAQLLYTLFRNTLSPIPAEEKLGISQDSASIIQSIYLAVTDLAKKDISSKKTTTTFSHTKLTIYTFKSKKAEIQIYLKASRKDVDPIAKGGEKEIFKVIDVTCACFRAMAKPLKTALHSNPLYLDSQIERVKISYERIDALQKKKVPFLCTIHAFSSIFSNRLRKNTFFSVSDLATQGDLLDVLDKKYRTEELPLTNKMKWIYQICTAVHNIHIQGYVHQDLKLDNILLTEEENICIIDFDFITKIGSDPVACGTWLYFPPEVFPSIIRKPYTAYDIWCIGCMMYILQYRTTTLPWKDEDEEAEIHSLPMQRSHIKKNMTQAIYQTISKIKKDSVQVSYLEKIYNKIMIGFLTPSPDRRMSLQEALLLLQTA